MRNIDLFDEYVAIVLAQLYESFPVKDDLDVRAITGQDPNEPLQPSQEAKVAYAAIEWLIETGYVRTVERRPPVGFGGCVLTAAGLNRLRRPAS